ncbi:MAG: FAD-dependent oxidoreductase [Armatimonadetes bacterium]|nr:FAD-dependent oxidoreductase [Armatimonadota bacterium]
MRKGETHDVVVYGGTAGGAITAIAAAKEGLSVVLLEPGQHIGGMVSGGLGRTDYGNKAVIGGMSLEFFRRVGKHYGEDVSWFFEPHVAEQVFRDWLAEAGVKVVFGQRVDAVDKKGTRLTALITQDGAEYRGRIFVDASYEGDLLPHAGISYTWGREAQSVYDETLAGRIERSPKHQFPGPVDPYNADGTLLPLIYWGPAGEAGQGDRKVQAYNFRLCLTDREDLRVLPSQPANYDRNRYLRLLGGLKAGKATVASPAVFNMVRLPNGKFDANQGYSWQGSDWVGANYAYPEADPATRRRIAQAHLEYVQGLLYFAQNDPDVPEAVQQDMRRYGLAGDEFVDHGHWPTQLYVREARRMIGASVLTEHDVRTNRHKPDGIAVGSYTIDCHGVGVRPHPVMGFTSEGGIGVPTRPYEIPYGVLCPPEHPNLLVPVCCSATHVAYGSLRMEPVYMMLGQAAANALHLAAGAGCGVREVPLDRLRGLLLEQQAILEAPYYPEVSITAPTGPVPAGEALALEAVSVGERTRLKDYWWELSGDGGVDATGPRVTWTFAKDGVYTVWLVARDETGQWTGFARAEVTVGAGGPRELLLDNEDRSQVRVSGPWLTSRARPLYHGDYYNHNVDDRTGRTAWRFVPKIPSAGRYRVWLGTVPDGNRASNVPVTITHADGESKLTADLRPERGPFSYLDLGAYRFEAGSVGSVLLQSEGIDGYLVVDSLRLVPER